MINKDISNSNRFASLSPEAAVLFTMMIPHYNSHGKMNGGPGYIKDEICPKLVYLNSRTIPRLLLEITKKTNVKWYKTNGRYWIHSINFLSDHQDLDPKRLGKDHIPDFSETCQIQVIPEVEVEVEVEVKEKVPVKKTKASAFTLPEWIKKDSWDAYEEMRREKKKIPTDRARELVVMELDKLRDSGQDPSKCLDQSTRCGWTDVYELKEKNNGKGGGNNQAGSAGPKPEPGKYGEQRPGDITCGDDGEFIVSK